MEENKKSLVKLAKTYATPRVRAALLLIIGQMRETLIQLHTIIRLITGGIFLVYAAIEKNRRREIGGLDAARKGLSEKR